MAQPARLITPEGDTIELTAEVYQQIKRLLAARSRRWSRARMDQVIHETYGKYAEGPSLIEALLAERAAERARDQAKLVRSHE